MSLAGALLAPRAVALVGASGDEKKNTSRPQRYMLKHGFTGKIYPVNPGRTTIFDLPCYKKIQDVEEKIDHAFIMIEDVESALEDCGAKGVPVATIFSDGFADAGAEGLARQLKLVARAKQLGVRLLGPNSMGMINLTTGATVSVNAILEMDSPPRGGTSLVSQSGTMLGAILSRGATRGLGFSKLVSVGNEADVGVGEIVQLLAADPETRTILLFLETIRDPERLAAGARAAHAAGKPVIAYKLGRSTLGERLARSHTGALAGQDLALDAFFRSHGIARVDLLETLIEAGPLFAGRKPPDAIHAQGRAPRISALTNTGGGAASVVDRLGSFGIEAVAPGSDAPIIDLTMGRKAAGYGSVLAELLEFEGNDAVLAVVGSSAQFHPQQVVAPIVAAPKSAKPLGVFLTPQAEASLALLGKAGIAAFRTPEACADAFRAYFQWRSPAPVLAHDAIALPAGLPAAGRLDEAQGLALFRALGVPVVRSAEVNAPDFAHDLPYPVALKILSAEVAHKSDVGGVVLGIADRRAFEQKAKILTASSPRLLVQQMEQGLGEAIVGYREDPVVGPLVMVGAGGILAELYNDVALALAPVDEAGALEMIGRVKGFAALRGFRGLPPGDLKALARAVAAMSRLALLQDRLVAEAEANPVLVKADGAVAVDALVVLKSGATASN